MKRFAMKVLVTGASGFLGRWIVQALLDAGHQIAAFCRRVPASAPNWATRVEWIQGNILAESEVTRAVSTVDAVVHCCGSVSLKPRDRAELELTNVTGTAHVLAAAAARSLRVVHTSSTATIGPSHEPRSLDESCLATALDFDCPYVETKRRAEAIALSYARDGVDVVVLNPGVVLGPGDLGATSTQIVLGYLTGRLRLHLPGGASFCDVRDVATAYVSALERGKRGERYILAGSNRSHAELQTELQALTDLPPSFPLPRVAADWLALWSDAGARWFPHALEDFNAGVVGWGSLFNYCDSSKAQRQLGYRSRPLSETLEDTITEHLKRGAALPSTQRLRQLLERASQQAP